MSALERTSARRPLCDDDFGGWCGGQDDGDDEQIDVWSSWLAWPRSRRARSARWSRPGVTA